MKIAKQVKYDQTFRVSEDGDYMLRILLNHPFGVLRKITYVYTEMESVTIRKIVLSLHNNRRMLLKYRHEYRFDIFASILQQSLKLLIYRAAFALGQGERLIARRSTNPTSEIVRDFRHARNTVYQIRTARFSSLASVPGNE